MTQTLTSAQRALCTATLPLVARLGRTTARRNPTVSREDLEGVGHEALVVAALRYDPAIGPFEPYAIYFVRGEMLNHVRKTLRTRARERRAPVSLIVGHPLDERSPADKLQDALERTTEMDREEIVLEMRLRAAGVSAELDGHPPDSDSEDAQLLHVLSSLERRSTRWDTDVEGARAALSAALSLILRLLGRDSDPARSREHVLLSVIAETRLLAGQTADIGALLPEIVEPSFTSIGALSVDSFLSKKARKDLAAALNTLLAAPSFASGRGLRTDHAASTRAA